MLDSNENLRRKKLQELLEEARQSSVSGGALDIGKAAFTTVLNLLSNTYFSFDLADPNSEMARNFKEMVCNIMMEEAEFGGLFSCA